jgi:ribosomal protein L16 Arg81 hydroxylase
MSAVQPVVTSPDSDRVAARFIDALQQYGFFRDIWEKQRLHIPAAFDLDELHTLFPLERFDDVLMSGSLMSPHLDIVRNGRKSAAAFRVSPSPATDAERILAELREGATVRVAHVEHYLPSLSAFCRSLEAVLHMPLRANLYMTPPFCQGFAPHFDLDDILVVQVVGSKDWYLHSVYAQQAVLPNEYMAFDSARHLSSAPPERVTLATGDVLYLPRGFMHEARTGDCTSIHITFAAIGIKFHQFIEQLVRNLSLRSPTLRKTITFNAALPPTSDELAALSAEVHRELEHVTDFQLLSDAANFMRHGLTAHRNPDLRGHLVDGIVRGFDAS